VHEETPTVSVDLLDVFDSCDDVARPALGGGVGAFVVEDFQAEQLALGSHTRDGFNGRRLGNALTELITIADFRRDSFDMPDVLVVFAVVPNAQFTRVLDVRVVFDVVSDAQFTRDDASNVRAMAVTVL
jgi:hypothetical protein